MLRRIPVDALAAAYASAASPTWDTPRIRQHAERFSRDFSHEICAVDETMAAPPDSDGEATQPAARRLPRRRPTPCSASWRSSRLLLPVRIWADPGAEGHPPLEQYLDILPIIA